MKIKSLYISAFGGLKNKKIILCDGFNVIYGNNENGKTTVMSFIKMMFYGSGRGSSSIEKNMRKKYMPWDGSPMAGSIEFTQNGKNYRLEREFRASDSTDKVTLFDLDSGISQTVACDVGKSFFGLSAAAFERSVFIGQAGRSEKDADAESELNSQLSNIVNTGDEQVSYNTVQKRISNAKTALKSPRKAGECDKNIKRLEELKSRLSDAENVYDNYSAWQKQAERFNAEAETERKELLELKADIEREQDILNADKLRELLKLKAELDAFKETCRLADGEAADGKFAGTLKFAIAAAEKAEEKLCAKSGEIERLKKSIEEDENPKLAEEKIKSLTAQKEKLSGEYNAEKEKNEQLKNEYEIISQKAKDATKARKKVNLPLLIAALFILTVGVVLLSVGMPFGAAVSAAAVVAAVLSFIIRPADKKQAETVNQALLDISNRMATGEREENRLLNLINDNRVSLLEANAESGKTTAERERIVAEYTADAKLLSEEFERKKSELLNYASKYKKAESIEEAKRIAAEIDAVSEKQKEMKMRIKYLCNDLGEISYETAAEKLRNMPDKTAEQLDFDALKKEYERRKDSLSEQFREFAAESEREKLKLKNTESPEDLKTQIRDTEQCIEEQERYFERLDVVSRVLDESLTELRRSYGSKLEKASGEIFKGLTGGKYNDMLISGNFDISVQESEAFGSRDAAYLSSGTLDQAYLSLRLALCGLLSEGREALPVMLDDALTQYDDDRTSAAMKFLKDYSNTNQLIMFTCHRSVYDEANRQGADCKYF